MTQLDTDTIRQADRLRHDLVAGLVATGSLASPAWRAAFEQVPRHACVPSFYEQSPTGQWLIDGSTPDEWLRGVYADKLLVISPDARSSSTVPSLMAVMLEALNPGDGDRVLEIGTGTGYNTALLCHRLGDRNVTTVDIDPQLADLARDRLAQAGHRPTIAAGDGIAGWPDHAPYDRLIATCAVEAIPPAWLTQVRLGGRIVVPITTGLAVLTVDGVDAAHGPFLPESAYFMPMRADNAPLDISGLLQAVTKSEAPTRPTTLDPDVWFDNGFRFLLAATEPGLQHLTKDPITGAAIFSHPDGSWAKVAGDQVAQDGPQRLWDLLEQTHREWDRLGHPSRERFTLAVAHDEQEIRLTGTSLVWPIITKATA